MMRSRKRHRSTVTDAAMRTKQCMQSTASADETSIRLSSRRSVRQFVKQHHAAVSPPDEGAVIALGDIVTSFARVLFETAADVAIGQGSSRVRAPDANQALALLQQDHPLASDEVSGNVNIHAALLADGPVSALL
mmetsp:Transcript_30972/g.51325  ORF Transcript_30972/g.51325 Transcript_30972/m.51325 type:complete len:135 (+) Transcript_30972:96-500(+)